MKKHRILFVKKAGTSPKFMSNDFDILSEKYDVTLREVNAKNNILFIFTMLWEAIYLLVSIWKFRLVYIWFADYHSFLPVFFAKLANKKSMVCAGGYECTYIPEINCGVFTKSSLTKRLRNFCVIHSLKKCSLILPVDESLVKNTNTYIYSDISGKAPLEDGIMNFIPDIKTRIETLHLGYDPEKFKRDNRFERSNTVISAGLIINDDEYRRKGFDLLVEAASKMPDVEFVLIGFNSIFHARVKQLACPNVKLLGILSYEKLIEEYSKAKVYAQISMFEGMPSTLSESMLCECIPVGSNINGIPRIIDNCGYLVDKKDVSSVIESLRRALNASPETGMKAKEHIITEFPLEKRKYKLLKIIDSLIN